MLELSYTICIYVYLKPSHYNETQTLAHLEILLGLLMLIINIDRYSLTKQSLIIGDHTIKEHQNSILKINVC